MESEKQIDRLTVVAIAIIAYAGANIAHELIGHCGMAVLMGTKCTVLSSTYIPLDPIPPLRKYNILVVAGCAGNFTSALVCLGLLRLIKARRPRLRYLLWLLMSVNLFLASTYITVAPIIKFGDSYILIENLPGQFFWRAAVTLVGATLMCFSFQVSRVGLGRLIGIGERAARAVAWKLVAPAYIAGGVLTVTSALFSRLAAKWAQLEAAGGTFGLTIWLLVLPLVVPQPLRSEAEHFTVSRSLAWIIAGTLTALVFIGVLGRGIRL